MPLWIKGDMATAIRKIKDGSMSFRDLERTYHIPKGTISGRLNGFQSRRDAHSYRRRSMVTQERELAEWVLDMGARHQPPSHHRCRLMALNIQRSSGSEPSLGREWL
jgi:hypothetical protein